VDMQGVPQRWSPAVRRRMSDFAERPEP